MREVQGCKLANFIGIGGGLKALRAEYSLTGRGSLSGMNVAGILFYFGSLLSLCISC